MLIATLRDLRAHAQKVRAAVASLKPSGVQLASRITEDRRGTFVNLSVGDNFNNLETAESSFATRLAGVLGSYYEIWNKLAADEYSFSQGYLHLLAAASPRDIPQNLLFLHTEPTAPPLNADEKQRRLSRWKSGPHLHVKASHFGLGRCHIHLDTMSNPCTALQSLPKYRDSLRVMVEMLVDELEQYFDPGEGRAKVS